ncbi:hypothetical protein V5O48_014428 [Marasmius crinis-equi]|uniref:Amine oxidase domain-containing protein n=1 Tax=Marasmius crinis-equi TaxID=585013 RepID=A0ABR3EXC0_9AGAR
MSLSSTPSARSHVVRNLFQNYLNSQSLPVPTVLPLRVKSPIPELPICIIGAGCAGLYAALLLDSLGIPYEILEFNDRIGGRIYTHRFNGSTGLDAPIGDPARYDYVDMGAMRYPKIPSMKLVFDLFERLGMVEDGLLIEYKYDSENTFETYNGIRRRVRRRRPAGDDSEREFDVFKVSKSNGGPVPDDLVRRGADNVAAEAFKPFVQKFEEEDFPTA